MNQAQSNNFNITSQIFVQYLDSLIIKLVKVYSIEYQIKPDPDAKEIVRKLLLSKANQLMSEESEKFTKKIVESIKEKIKGRNVSICDVELYEFLKLVGLENA